MRFWEKVDKNGPVLVAELGECWVWTGSKRTGYGMIREDGESGKMRSAHRLSWAWANEMDYPERNTLIRHRCDNPPCIRPDHLESGNYKDNSHDMLKRDRGFSLLNNDLVAEARNRARTGESLHEIVKDMPEGVTVNTLADAVRGQTFPFAEAEPVSEPSFARKKYQKLSDEAYLEIYEALRVPWHGQGLFLARKYGVDKSLISLIKNGKFRPASLDV